MGLSVTNTFVDLTTAEAAEVNQNFTDITANALDKDGSVPLTANWDAGSFDIRAATLTPDGITLGSVMFAGTDGVISQDNSNFFYDPITHRLGLGINSGLEEALDIDGNILLEEGGQLLIRHHGFRNAIIDMSASVLRIITNTQGIAISFVVGTTEVAKVDTTGLVFGNGNRTIKTIGATDALTISGNSDLILQTSTGGGTGNIKLEQGVGNTILEIDTSDNIGLGTAAFPSTGSLGLVFGDGTALSSMGSNTAGFYADDVGGTVNGFSINEADRLTRLTGPFSPLGANLEESQIEFASTELTGLSGATATATSLIPAGSFIVGVTVRVTTEITGATTFDIGDGTDVDRWGAAIALTAGTTTSIADFTADGFGQFAAANDVVLTRNGSDFSAGAVRITVHYLNLVAATS